MILLDVKKLWYNFTQLSTQVAPGYTFSQYRNVERINKYLNNQFYNPKTGLNYFFYNLSQPRVLNFAKSIDLDSKNFKAKANNHESEIPTFVSNAEFRKWAKENQFGIKLNEIADNLATYGSIVLKVSSKKNKTAFDVVDLRNIAFNPIVDRLAESSWIVERHIMTRGQILAKKGIWTGDVENALRIAEKVSPEAISDPNQLVHTSLMPLEYVIWEYVGDRYVQDENETKSKLVHMILAGSGTGKEVVQEVLFEEEIEPKDSPYRDVVLGTYKGRWQRMGVVEKLYPAQERMNALVNQNSRASELSAMVWFTSAKGTSGNLLNPIKSGDVIPDDTLRQMQVSNPGLSGFMTEYNQIQQLADELCGTLAPITGEDLPASQTYGQARIQNYGAQSTFQVIREFVALQLRDIMVDKVLKQIMKGLSREHVLEIMDPDMFQAYDEAVAIFELSKAIQSGVVYSSEAAAEYKQLVMLSLQKKNKRRVKVPSGFFNFEIGIEVDPTDEETDTLVDFNNKQQLMEQVNQNLDVVENPIFQSSARDMGVSIYELQKYAADQKKKMQTQGAKGGNTSPAKLAIPSQDVATEPTH